MRKIYSNDLLPGMIIAREVLSGEDVVLLEKGTCLSFLQIANLRNWKIPYVYIVDDSSPITDEAPPADLSSVIFLGEYLRTVDVVRHTFEHIRLFREVPVMEMEELADQKIILLADTVGILDHLYEIRQHNDSTFQHSLNVAIVAAILGRWQKYKGVELKNLILAGLLHDIGKLFVPQTVLDKPGALLPREFEIIKSHPYEGYQLVKDIDRIFESTKLGILQHHERRDGSGYPSGLVGDEIHDYAKIIAIADIYAAMTSDRAYRRRLTPLAALETISEQMPEKLEPEVCLTFFDNIRDYFIGNPVIISNGQKAKIVSLSSRGRDWTKPIVCTPEGTMLDLEKEGLSVVDLVEGDKP